MPAAETVPVIAIDGPVGSGKGTVAHRVAAALGFTLLDSGALYRTLALAARAQRVSFDDAPALARLAQGLDVDFTAGDVAHPVRPRLAGVDVGDEIRSEQCGNDASLVSAWPEVRTALLALQRGFRRPPGLVADGRDMGSVVFPDAPVKVFLTATPEERARRRHKQLMVKGIDVSVTRLRGGMVERDRRDRERVAAPLKPAGDAIVVDTTGMDVDTVVGRVLAIVNTRTTAGPAGE